MPRRGWIVVFFVGVVVLFCFSFQWSDVSPTFLSFPFALELGLDRLLDVPAHLDSLALKSALLIEWHVLL